MNLEIQQRKKISILPWLMLTSRLILFTFFQACFALGFYIAKAGDPWGLSLLYWPLGVISANLCCLVFLFLYYRSQGVSYFEYFKFQRESIKKDVLLMIALFFLSIILSMAPNIGLATILFGNPQAGMEMMDHGIPLWVKLFSLPLLPITQMFAEIPIYMVYCAPELQKQGLKSWVSFGLGALFLSFQHIAMPLIFDGTIIIYRLLMFLPFSIFIGLILFKSPRLLPYMIIVHGLMDLSLVITLLVF